MADTKLVYRADTKELAEMEIESLAGKWESVLEKQPGETDHLFSVHRPNAQADLCHQCGRRLSSANSEGDKNQGGLHLRCGTVKAGPLGDQKH